ncbi:hypothetical protein H312_03049, partial [Anncaliia algerae PRA339]
DDIDKQYIEYMKRDFDLKYLNHQTMLPWLIERDSIIEKEMSEGNLLNFFPLAIINHPLSSEILPLDCNNSFRSDFVNFLKVNYEKNYSISVELRLNKNIYLDNEVLTKKFNLETCESEKVVLKWKERADSPIFTIFESDDANLIVFDILYEIYINSYKLFCMKKK